MAAAWSGLIVLIQLPLDLLKLFPRSCQHFLLDLKFFAGDQIHARKNGLQNGPKLCFQLGPSHFELLRHGLGQSSGDLVKRSQVWLPWFLLWYLLSADQLSQIEAVKRNTAIPGST